MRPVVLWTKAPARYEFLMWFRRYRGLSCAETSVRRPATEDHFKAY